MQSVARDPSEAVTAMFLVILYHNQEPCQYIAGFMNEEDARDWLKKGMDYYQADAGDVVFVDQTQHSLMLQRKALHKCINTRCKECDW